MAKLTTDVSTIHKQLMEHTWRSRNVFFKQEKLPTDGIYFVNDLLRKDLEDHQNLKN